MKIKLHVGCYKSVSDYGDVVQTHRAFTLRDAPVTVPFGDTTHQKEMKRGDVIHNLLEVLPNILANESEKTATIRVSKIDGFSDSEKEKIVESTLNVLRMSDVFAQGSRAQVPIIGSVDGYHGRRINRRVDRLDVQEDKILKIDFKTNRPLKR